MPTVTRRAVAAVAAAVLALAASAAAQSPPACPPPPAGYDGALWAKAWALHHDALVIDTHVDTTSRILDRGFDVGPRANDGHFDLVRAQEGGLDAVFHSIYVDARFAGDERALFATAPQDINADWPRPGDPGAANGSARRALMMIDGIVQQAIRDFVREGVYPTPLWRK